MHPSFSLLLILVGCVTVLVHGQASSGNCGEDNSHGQMTYAECEARFANNEGACLQPGNCANDQCQKKCYLCQCADKGQCKVRGTGKNEEVYCDCSLVVAGTGYGPHCNSECDSKGGCTGTHIHCDLTNFSCVCDNGYEKVGTTCHDINECTGSPCPAEATCQNQPGSYQCHCPEGTKYDADSNTCVSLSDINECLLEINGGCGNNAICVNTDGSYFCHCLQPGFFWNGEECEDIDECAENNGDCNNAKCVNTVGSRVCMCPCGTSWNGAFCLSNNGCGGGVGGCGGYSGGSILCFPEFPGHGHGEGHGGD